MQPATTTTPPHASDPGSSDRRDELLLGMQRHPSGAAAWILQHRQGQLHSELTEALAAVLLACADNDRAGEISLRIRVQLNPDVPGQMVLSDRVQIKLPPRANARPYLYDADGMRIAGEEPGQLSISLLP